MSSVRLPIALVVAGILLAPVALAQQPSGGSSGSTHEDHMAQMEKDAELKEHGRMAMGFDLDKTTHHFTLSTTGGLIAVTANDPADWASRDQIRTHLAEIAQAFGRGDFEKPLMTHGELPPGAADMQRDRAAITYTFEPTDRGGLVRITSSDSKALEAIHTFLRYQIREHKTGDRLTVQR